MESIVKLDQPIISPIVELLGENNFSSSDRVIELNLSEGLKPEEVQEEASSVKKLSLGIEDTKSLWANMRSKLKPTNDDWLSAKDEILETISLVNSVEIVESPDGLSTVQSNLLEGESVEANSELYDLLNEATTFLKEELGFIKTELSNIHLYKGAIQSLGSKISENDLGIGQFKTALEESGWVIGGRIDQFEEKFERFKEELPGIQRVSNENVLVALRAFEEKCLRLGATQLDSLLSVKNLVGNSKVEQLQETLMYLISGQKRVLESIADIMSGLRSVSANVAQLPNQEMVEDLGLRQEEKIDLLKLEIVESRIEDRTEERFLKKAVICVGITCMLTFAALIYSLL